MTTQLPRLAECRDCHDPIRFVRMVATGRPCPVDPMPNPDRGTIAAQIRGRDLVGFVITPDHRADPTYGLRFVPHGATCPERPKPRIRPVETDVPLFP
jgi:hypothetical protein